ncbi:MAG TPA: FG-GAP-like repeat-containing protein, partial [Nitrospiria bacterium]|nr:FG-GAP-like repeat-containing protein [Nitrospiria bacterium]
MGAEKYGTMLKSFSRLPNFNKLSGWAARFAALLWVVGLLPSVGQSATWNVNVGNNFFRTQSSLNPADVNTNHITIDVGDTITWTWIGNTHSVTSSTGSATGACSSGDIFNSGVNNTGATFSQTFGTATPSGGDCKYYCSVHSSPGATSGQVGFIQVGGFTPPPSGGGGGGGATAAAGNFNGDAHQDLGVVDSIVGKTEIFLNNGNGGFTAPPTIVPSTDPTYTPVSVAAGSFNDSTDALDDIVVVEKTPDGITFLSIYFGNGAGGFTLFKQRSVPGLDTATAQIATIERGDFNGDGIADLVVTGPVSAQTNDVILIVLPGD